MPRNQTPSDEAGSNISVHSLFGSKEKRPLVQLSLDERPIFQVPTNKAREIALMLIEAAEASEGDGFLVTFVKDTLGASEAAAVVMLRDFRLYRESLRDREASEAVDPAPLEQDTP